MISSPSDCRRYHLVSAAVALLILTGCSTPAANSDTGGQAGSSEQPAATSPAAAPATDSAAGPAPGSATPAPEASHATAPTPTAAPAPSVPKPPAVLPESAPVSFTIPSTGAHSELLSLGLRDNGSLEVPPGDPGAPAGWYNQSPTPGERGPAVLLGHVNATDSGPGVFADLRALRPGDTIDVLREDGTTATFTVDHAEQYPKDAFLTATVYGNTEGSELRLITCDGYDPATGQFDDNYVVYAKLAT